MEKQRPWIRHYDYNVPTTIRYPRIAIHELIQRPSKMFPDLAATDFFGTQMTYWELRTHIFRMANALGKLGVHKGERVGIHLPTSPQYIIAFFATVTLGAITVNLNPMYTAEEIKSLANDTGITTLITFDMVLPTIRTVAQDVEFERVIVTAVTDFVAGMPVATAKSLDLEEGWHHFSTVLENSTSTRIPRVDISPQDPAVIQFTGGTTGLPKGAVLTHANIVAATFQCSLWGNPSTGEIPIGRRTVLGVLPFFHVYGLIVVMCWAFFSTATQILVPRFDLDEMMDLLGRFDSISFFPTVPTMINAIINHPKAGELNLEKRLGGLNSGAAPLAVELIDKIKDMGIFFSEGWGMSETTSLASPTRKWD